MEQIVILILVFTVWLCDLGLAVLRPLHTSTAASSCYHGVGLSAASTEKSLGGDSRKLWEEPLTRDLASLRGRAFGLCKLARTEGTLCYEHADSQANGAGCLPRGCTACSWNLCLLGMDIGDFWHCNSNLAAALNSLYTSLPLCPVPVWVTLLQIQMRYLT